MLLATNTSSIVGGIFLRQRLGLSDIRLHRKLKRLGAFSPSNRESFHCPTFQACYDDSRIVRVQPDSSVTPWHQNYSTSLAEIPFQLARYPDLRPFRDPSSQIHIPSRQFLVRLNHFLRLRYQDLNPLPRNRCHSGPRLAIVSSSGWASHEAHNLRKRQSERVGIIGSDSSP